MKHTMAHSRHWTVSILAFAIAGCASADGRDSEPSGSVQSPIHNGVAISGNERLDKGLVSLSNCSATLFAND